MKASRDTPNFKKLRKFMLGLWKAQAKLLLQRRKENRTVAKYQQHGGYCPVKYGPNKCNILALLIQSKDPAQIELIGLWTQF